jgi:hypothetical protein
MIRAQDVRMKSYDASLWTPRVLVGMGFVMLFLTSLQGWGMVGIISFAGQTYGDLLVELKRLHNLGLSGSFMAISVGLTLLWLPSDQRRTRLICRVLLPSLLLAPVAFCDRALSVVLGSIPFALQVLLYCLQAASAMGITASLGL